MNTDLKDIQIESLEALDARKRELTAEISKSEEKLAGIWNDMFHNPEEDTSSPTQRALNFVSSATGVIDGALLGWKLYNRFGKGLKLFKKKKK